MLNNLEHLKGKKVLVTGAGSGIGAEITRSFAKYGAHVGIHYRNSFNGAHLLQREIQKKGGTAKLFKADLFSFKQCLRLMKDFVREFGTIDVLVNNAGAICGPKHFSKLDEKSWNQTINLNTRAAFLLCREALAVMKERKRGKIINISSVALKYGGSETSMHYAAAKAALETLTLGFSRFGAKYGICVNAVRGGFIETGFHKKIGRSMKDIKNRIDVIPLKRAGTPADIALMVLFLASGAGDFITGETFTVSGGD
jgi:3-oxoacyl-[acyl-carrier protein] reductase